MTSRLARVLGQSLQDLLAVVLPPVCPVCDRIHVQPGDAGVCVSCWAQVEYLAGPICPRCGRPHPDFEDDDLAGMVCGSCLTRQPPFDVGISMGLYRGSLKALIRLLKFSDRTDLAAPLAARAATVLRSRRLHAVDRIVPVPLPALRRLRRGYNQAAVVARELGRRLAVPVDPGVLGRRGLGKPQAGLPSRRRRANVQGAFRLRRPARVQDLSILLVDDVWTTGETLAECSRVLLEGGARRVAAFSLARTPDHFDLGSPGGLD